MPPKSKASSASQPLQPIKYKTIGEKLQAEYLASRPLQVAFETKGWDGLTANEKTAYANFKLLESGAYRKWGEQQQKDLTKVCEQSKIPVPLPNPFPLGSDRKGKKLEDYTVEEYAAWRREQAQLGQFRDESDWFREGQHKGLKGRILRPATAEEINEEKARRVKIAEMETGKAPGNYGGDPAWDDVVPIPQDDGEKPLAAIAYSDEYAEAIAYLRAVMAVQEHSPRVLSLTAHIIDMNPAHYTVWLYRAKTLFALNSDLYAELDWVNEVALDNQKNYQIWHHRQLLIDSIYPTISSDRSKVLDLARTEIAFLTQMFDRDSKNYHVWSYRQYLVRKLSLFPSQCSGPSELESIEILLRKDVRNNSAWSHRFFLVFSDPGTSTPDCKATVPDPAVPSSIIDRELQFAQAAVWEAPQNQSPWNYIRGILRKGGRQLSSIEAFATEFVILGGESEDEEIKSSHALDFLADAWVEKGEIAKADKALRLLEDKYDPIRKNYWEWRRAALTNGKVTA